MACLVGRVLLFSCYASYYLGSNAQVQIKNGTLTELGNILKLLLQQTQIMPQAVNPFLPPAGQGAPQQSQSTLDSPFGPQLPYNPQPPVAPGLGAPQPHGGQPGFGAQPPPFYMGRPGGTAECSGPPVPGQLCCDGIVNPLPPGGGMFEWACCHKGMYHVMTQMCCGDIPVPKPPSGPPMMCCGTMLFNPATHICCDAFPVLNQGNMMKCCRKSPYNPVTQMCCAEAVRPRMGSNLECCGKNAMYNPVTQMCCSNDTPMPKDPINQCCGKKHFFQPAFQQCCNGDPIPKDAFCMV